ncbi:hypothetical protein COCON_G00128860 [Conger conger]|uniref:Endothelin-1 n=1 Tax=Conger conger TaxID=82655 RepID=A0A9Q1HX95_CONCO|nr:endothelin-1 [Conger conger]KAJ8267714.1 hypothetical protein COCON_G00128860 [Conger conger]
MELRVVITVLSIIVSGFLQTVTPAPTSPETEPVATTRPSPRHIRTKRCSCATFLDKECIYFCHLDIIWINTPERTVSYGLGSAPRKKRSLEKPLLLSRTQQRKRCQCADKEDSTCSMFCQPDNTPARSQAARLPSQGSGCTTWQCLYNRAANKRQIKRTEDSRPWSRTPWALRNMWRAILRRAQKRAQARAQGGKKAAP